MFKKRLNKTDLADAQELQRLTSYFKRVALLIGNNTALIEDGKKVKNQYEAIVKLLEQDKQDFIAAALVRAGLKNRETAQVDLQTGAITIIPGE